MYTFKEVNTPTVGVFDQTGGQMTQHIRNQLVKYKQRWNESLANNLVIYHPGDVLPADVPIIVSESFQDKVPALSRIVIPTITDLSHYNLRRATIDVDSTTITTQDELLTLIKELQNYDTITCDFETASKFSDEEKEQMKQKLTTLEVNSPRWKKLTREVNSDGLSHPSMVEITHFSVAVSETKAWTVLLNPELENIIMDFLCTTTIKQVWHNLSFDGKLIYHRTNGKFPTNYEDTQLMWAIIRNHTQTHLAKSGLKTLAKKVYGSWGVDDEIFNISQRYNDDLAIYASWDAAATFYVYNEALLHPEFQSVTPQREFTNILPVPLPRYTDSREDRFFFYSSVIKPMVPHIVKLMMQGITMDDDKVNNLADVIDDTLATVHEKLATNKYIIQFQKQQYLLAKQSYISQQKGKLRTIDYYTKELDLSKVDHRSYVMNYINLIEPLQYIPTTLLPDGTVKWTVKDVKHLTTIQPTELVQSVLDKTMDPTSHIAVSAMRMLAVAKTNIYNKKYIENIENVDESILPPFNPGSSKQLRGLFDMLNIPSTKVSKTTGEPSYDRDMIEQINKSTTDEDVKELTQLIIDYSFSAIIKSNFLTGFTNYTIDGALKGNIRLLGTKSARPTSNRVNLLQLPSTGSIFAKPVKECFVAKEGFLVATADFSGLEEITAANVTLDANKIKIQRDGYDSHCFHAAGYYSRVEEILGPNDGSLEWNRRFKSECSSNKELKALRQSSKPVSFKLMFGGMPDADRGGNITNEIYHKFHNELYPGITKYNNEVVLEQANREHEVYMGLGFSIKTNSPDKDARTLCNVTIQFWDIITLIVIPQLNDRIAKANLANDIFITATIYDAIYFEVRDNSDIISWLNVNLVELMTQPMFTEVAVPNSANLEIGSSWANLVELPNNASIEEIEQARKELKDAK